MRRKIETQRYFSFGFESSVKVVRQHRSKYNAISEILDANPDVISLAHRDLARSLSSSLDGRRSDYTSEQIIRSLVVMFVEGDGYRDVVIRIEENDFLRNFVRLGVMPMMDFTFLSRAYGVLSDQTWQAINEVLSEYAFGEEKITGQKLRLDATAVEVNIHYPTDSSLLWDSFRTLASVLQHLQQNRLELGLDHRYHVRKIKKLAYFIARNGSSSKKRTQHKVKKAYRTLIERVGWIVGVAYEALELAGPMDFETVELARTIPIIERIIDQAHRRIFKGEKVPADEKVYSLFEDHAELLIRGKAGKPIEFGHKVLIAQTGEKFIHHYQVLPQQRDDIELLVPTLQAHEQLFGTQPEVLAADKGFYKSTDQLAALENEIETVSIGKKGRRTQAEYDREHTDAFMSGQRFRAGSEGSISVLKRAFKLGKCLFKGFKNYAAAVGCAIFCHNLVLLTRL